MEIKGLTEQVVNLTGVNFIKLSFVPDIFRLQSPLLLISPPVVDKITPVQAPTFLGGSLRVVRDLRQPVTTAATEQDLQSVKALLDPGFNLRSVRCHGRSCSCICSWYPPLCTTNTPHCKSLFDTTLNASPIENMEIQSR